VTAILGFNYLDGILMMADTEESLGGGAKSECDKLHRFIFPVGNPAMGKAGTVITGGAGYSHFIDCANQELRRLFTTAIATEADIVPVLSGFAKKFFRETMQGYHGMASELVPDFSMLIAINIAPSSWLFRWEANRVLLLPEFTHGAIGSGVVQIHPMLRDVQFSASKECLLFHGMRMMFCAKRAVVGVGGKTEAVALQNDGTTHYFGTGPLQKIEELIVNYEQFKIKVLDGDISTIAATDSEIEPELEANIENNLAELPAVLKQYRQAYKDILKEQLDARKTNNSQAVSSS
jgi:hypothetical protein